MIEVFSTRTLRKPDYEKALQNGIKITSQNFIQTTPILSEEMSLDILKNLDTPAQSLLFTSKNAVRTTLEYYLSSIPKIHTASWEIYCLSGATKTALLAHFEEKQITGSADQADDLTKKIANYKRANPIHFFCGNRRRNTLPDFMQRHHIPFKEWVVYQTKSTAHPVSKDYGAYLFYSPSAVESFFSINHIKKDIPCFSIGQTTAKALKERVENPVYIGKKPNTDYMLENLFHHFKTEA